MSVLFPRTGGSTKPVAHNVVHADLLHLQQDTGSDLLRNPCHINDSIINAYCDILRPYSSQQNVVIFQVDFLTALTAPKATLPKWLNAPEILKAGALSTVDMILAPFHIAKSLHWTLLVVDVKRGTLRYFDSMQAS